MRDIGLEETGEVKEGGGKKTHTRKVRLIDRRHVNWDRSLLVSSGLVSLGGCKDVKMETLK